jgi:protein TonB
MFEDSTFESTGRIHTRSRRWMIATFILNASILLTLILVPLVFPEALPKQLVNILLVAPPPPPAAAPEPQPQPKTTEAFHGRPEMVGLNLTVPTKIPTGIRTFGRPEAPAGGDQIAGIGDGPGIPGAPSIFRGPFNQPVVRPEVKGPVHISAGVVAGMLLQKKPPVYPSIAIAMRLEGTVVLQATISKSGTIENLRVLGGPAMLQQSALDAVREWRYRPYLLNGEPVEVETTVNVIFNLGR